jgi:non-canonical purine NTP pyrophosphatase (RdgB/HAM1 family)
MLYYVTSNKEKIITAKKHLDPHNISFTSRTLPLIEIQSDSIEEITVDKAKQAFEILKQSLLVNDHGWDIPGLNGFPGPYMKYMNEWLSSQDFLNLTKDLKDRTIILHEVACFKDDKITKIFKTDFHGTLIKEIRGRADPAMSIVTFDNVKTVAEYMEGKISPFKENAVWEEFAEWYIKR